MTAYLPMPASAGILHRRCDGSIKPTCKTIGGNTLAGGEAAKLLKNRAASEFIDCVVYLRSLLTRNGASPLRGFDDRRRY